MAGVDNERVAQILADAVVSGNDRKTAKKYGITDKTVRNYRARLVTDEQLSAVFRRKLDEVELSWRADLVRTMRVALRRARRLLKTETDLNKVTNLIKEGGGVGTAREALGVDGPRDHRERPPVEEGPGGSGEGAGESSAEDE